MSNLMRSRRAPHHFQVHTQAATVSSESEPMQIGFTHLTHEDRERSIRNHLCLYCGLSSHLRASCPTRPAASSSTMVSSTPDSINSLEVPIALMFNGKWTETVAMIDSGAAGNFIDIRFAKTPNLPLVPCESRVAVAALDGRPLGTVQVKFITKDLCLWTGILHTETIRLFAIDSPQNPIILGLPWLERHNPRISWTSRQILQWSDTCQQNCLLTNLSHTSPWPTQKIDDSPIPGVPSEYHDLIDAFSKTKASQLPPHRLRDCSIDIIPGSSPSRGRVFPLSQPESEAMKAYIEEELSKGFIRPSTSPASASFFFVKKKEGRSSTMHRLPQSQWDNSQIPLPSTSSPSSSGATLHCKIFHQARPLQCLQSDSHSGGRRVEDCFLNNVWAQWISRYVIRIGQQSFNLPYFH